MDLEKEIQGKFEDDYHKAVVNVSYTYSWLSTFLREKLGKHGITQQQFNILRILRGQYPNPATVNLLKERMVDKMCDASRIVDRLVQKELVTRCTNSNDRRAVDIRISKTGLEILAVIDQELKMKDFFGDHLTEEEASTLCNLLDKLRG